MEVSRYERYWRKKERYLHHEFRLTYSGKSITILSGYIHGLNRKITLYFFI